MRDNLFAGSICLIFAMPGAALANELTASVWAPPTHPVTKYGFLDWAEDLEQATDGSLTTRVYTGTAVLPAEAHLSGLRDGVVDITYHAGTYTPNDLPEDNVIAALSIGLQDSVVIAAATTDFNMNDMAMRARHKTNGVVYLGGYASPPYILMCNKKVVDLATIAGARIRMPGAIHSQWAATVDSVPVSVPSTEMFSGLERGQLDCAANSANDLKGRSLWEVAKHVTMVNLGSYYAGWLHAMNRDAWAGLTIEERQALLASSTRAVVRTTLGYKAMAEEAISEAAAEGVVFYEPADDLAEAISSFASTEGLATAISMGTNTFGLTDVEGLISRFKATVAKWEQLLEGVDRSDAGAIEELLVANIYSQLDMSSYGLD